MISLPENGSDKIARRSLSFFQELLSDFRPRDFAVRLWDGTTWDPEHGMAPRFTFVINSPACLRRMIREPREISLAEAYLSKDIDIEGDISSAFRLADHLIDKKRPLLQSMRLGMKLLGLPGKDGSPSGRHAACPRGECHSRERDRQAISYHYDVSNEFYSLWLDRNMVYSCAYFKDPGQDLDAAQEQKLDYICRKLRLNPGERLLDIGCGWGALVVYAASNYGVKARGITLSRAQAEFAGERIRKERLQKQCSVEVCDYRDLPDTNEFDKLVSVGMFEHVGEKLLPIYFKKASSLLKPGGVFLNHGIAVTDLLPLRRGETFINRYVFPDGEILPVSTTLRAAEQNGFEVRDVESLREHYAITLRQWVERLEANRDQACRLTDETTCRIWRLYMAASAYGFTTGRLNLYQALLSKSERGPSNLPLNRDDWYRKNDL